MIILHKELRKGQLSVRLQSQNDLWHLSHIIDIGDFVSGKTYRKIKVGEGERASQTTIKVFMKIQVEKLEFHKHSDKLRASGKIVEGPEDISRGQYHTFNLEPSVEVTIEKQKWLKYQLDKLKEAEKEKDANVLIILLDREHALFAELKNYGFDVLTELSGNVQKKASPEKVKDTFYSEVIAVMRDYDKRNSYSKMVLASPAFWKEYYMGLLTKDEAKKILSAACNSVDVDGISEVLKRPEVLTALKDDRVVKEINLVEELLVEIRKDGAVAYGVREASRAAESGSIRSLLVTDSFIRRAREAGTYGKIDHIMSMVDSMKGEINIISSEHDGGKKLDGLGGIGALLRYKI
jgi:protein pelota